MAGELDDLRQRVLKAYEPAAFAQAGHGLLSAIETYYQQAVTQPTPVLAANHPPTLIQQAEAALQMPTAGPWADRLIELGKLILTSGNRLHSPRYMGHQVPAVAPPAALGDFVGACMNQPMAIFEMGPISTAIERTMTHVLMRTIGWSTEQSDGIATHGGSLANLTALLTARNVQMPTSWSKGVLPGRTLLVASADAHYSVARSAGILGLGANQILSAPIDAKRRIDANRLDDLIVAERQAGRLPLFLVGSACTTPIGSFDPLHDLADIAARHGLWLHVDGAHGASALLSRRHRSLLAGIERADSIVWDAHKMLFVPALCTFVFYKDKRHSYQTCQQNAPYLFDPDAPGQAEFDGGIRTLECTKRSLALGLWMVWSLFGPAFFEDLIDLTFALARRFYDLLRSTDDFIALHEPECNIVCFRHVPTVLQQAPVEVVSDFQHRLRQAIVSSGEFYITLTKLDGVAALRIVVMNPQTDESHLEELLSSLRRNGQKIINEGIR